MRNGLRSAPGVGFLLISLLACAPDLEPEREQKPVQQSAPAEPPKVGPTPVSRAPAKKRPKPKKREIDDARVAALLEKLESDKARPGSPPAPPAGEAIEPKGVEPKGVEPKGVERRRRFRSWYPGDITPPAGTEYPCKLTALPKGLPGIPAEHAQFIDHVFAMILRITQAKLVLLEVYRRGKRGVRAAQTTYERDVKGLLKKLRAEPPPDEQLKAFQEEVAKAIQLQQVFFQKSVPVMESNPHPQGYYAVFKIPEGKAASGLLARSWGRVNQHYAGFKGNPATRDSICHHLCALDLF